MNESYPKIGMSHTVHKEIGVFEMMMSLIYHPRNSHCIYIDQKAEVKVFEAVNGIVNCYKEKFLKVINVPASPVFHTVELVRLPITI